MDLSTSLLKNLTTIQGMKSNKNVAGKASNDVIIDYASGDKNNESMFTTAYRYTEKRTL